LHYPVFSIPDALISKYRTRQIINLFILQSNDRPAESKQLGKPVHYFLKFFGLSTLSIERPSIINKGIC